VDFVGLFGGQGVNRTLDTKIFSLLLYRLSYLPTGTSCRRQAFAAVLIRTCPDSPLQQHIRPQQDAVDTTVLGGAALLF
jgi:hypothetical protein